MRAIFQNMQVQKINLSVYSWYYAEARNERGVTTVRFGTELQYGTVRFWQKVRYGITYEIFRKRTVRYTEMRYYIFRTVRYTFRTPVMHALHFCFQVLHFSFLPR